MVDRFRRRAASSGTSNVIYGRLETSKQPTFLHQRPWLASIDSAPRDAKHPQQSMEHSGLPVAGRSTRMCSPWHLGNLGVLDPRCRFRRRKWVGRREWQGVARTWALLRDGSNMFSASVISLVIRCCVAATPSCCQHLPSTRVARFLPPVASIPSEWQPCRHAGRGASLSDNHHCHPGSRLSGQGSLGLLVAHPSGQARQDRARTPHSAA